MNNRKHSFLKAFSLAEAMIILLLISIAVMALIPLISKATNVPRWRIHPNVDNRIVYGLNPGERVGVGTDDVGTAPAAKLTASSLAFAPSNPDRNSIDLGYFTSAAGIVKYKANDSVILGVNPCIAETGATNSVLIRASSCADNTIDIGEKITSSVTSSVTSSGTNILNLSAANPLNPFISIEGTKFTISDPAGNGVLEYEVDGGVDRLTINTDELYIGEQNTDPSNPEPFNPTTTTRGTLFLDSYGSIDPDEYSCESDVKTETLYSFEAVKTFFATYSNPSCTHVGTRDPIVEIIDDYRFDCKDKIRNKKDDSDSYSSYCWDFQEEDGLGWGPPEVSETSNTQPFVWSQTSDRRLKNIISEFKKGINELKNIKTFNFTYKNDPKKKNKVGLVAQDLKDDFDIALHEDENGYLSYEREPVFYAMINAVKEIFELQNKFEKKNKKLNRNADRLIRMYE